MSTTICNAWISRDTGVYEVQRYLMNNIDVMRAMCEEDYKDIIAKHYLSDIDVAAILTNPAFEDTQTLSCAMNPVSFLEDRRKRFVRSKDDIHRFDNTVTLIEAGKDVIIMFHGFSDSTIEFLNTSGFDNFEYWDNTDPPDGVDDDEWKSRNDVYKKYMPTGIPSLSGVVITLTLNNDIFLRYADDHINAICSSRYILNRKKRSEVSASSIIRFRNMSEAMRLAEEQGLDERQKQQALVRSIICTDADANMENAPLYEPLLPTPESLEEWFKDFSLYDDISMEKLRSLSISSEFTEDRTAKNS